MHILDEPTYVRSAYQQGWGFNIFVVIVVLCGCGGKPRTPNGNSLLTTSGPVDLVYSTRVSDATIMLFLSESGRTLIAIESGTQRFTAIDVDGRDMRRIRGIYVGLVGDSFAYRSLDDRFLYIESFQQPSTVGRFDFPARAYLSTASGHVFCTTEDQEVLRLDVATGEWLYILSAIDVHNEENDDVWTTHGSGIPMPIFYANDGLIWYIGEPAITERFGFNHGIRFTNSNGTKFLYNAIPNPIDPDDGLAVFINECCEVFETRVTTDGASVKRRTLAKHGQRLLSESRRWDIQVFGEFVVRPDPLIVIQSMKSGETIAKLRGHNLAYVPFPTWIAAERLAFVSATGVIEVYEVGNAISHRRTE